MMMVTRPNSAGCIAVLPPKKKPARSVTDRPMLCK
jgi:hypothetical protein